MCDRILVFSSKSRPGGERTDSCRFRHRATVLDLAFWQMVDDIYALMTRRAAIEHKAEAAPISPLGCRWRAWVPT